MLGTLRGRGSAAGAYTVAEIVIPFPLIAAGEQHVASSLAAILIAAVPLFIALLALRFDPAERAEGRRLVGLFVGLAGVIALVGIDVSGNAGRAARRGGDPRSPRSATPSARWCSSARCRDLDPRATMGGALAIASLVLAPAAADPSARDDAVVDSDRRRSWCSACSAPRRRSCSSAC